MTKVITNITAKYQMFITEHWLLTCTTFSTSVSLSAHTHTASEDDRVVGPISYVLNALTILTVIITVTLHISNTTDSILK